MFSAYGEQYASSDGFALPALLPQIYLHYDPRFQSERSSPSPLFRQRMDFLLLVPHRNRIVIEVDGKQHYATDSGSADPTRYASMMKEDHDLRLGGYEVYRFGGMELVDKAAARAMLKEFFEKLLQKHGVLAR